MTASETALFSNCTHRRTNVEVPVQ